MEKLHEHPISISAVFPIKLSIKANVEPNPLEDVEIPYSLSVSHSDYDYEQKTIAIAVKFEIEEKSEESGEQPPFSMLVEVVAHFKVDDEKFPIDQIYHWATRNAPYIIYPYLREHIQALTIRTGFKPMLLPLVSVPTFKILSKEESKPI
jgi:preprotein translocase subunit SecB